MKNKRTESAKKENNFKTHKDDRNFGHRVQRNNKQANQLSAWGE